MLEHRRLSRQPCVMEIMITSLPLSLIRRPSLNYFVRVIDGDDNLMP